MPQVKTKKARKEFPCNFCQEKIKPGQEYYTWSFRYAGKRRKHVSHGAPKPSELTVSKMSGVYAAVEAAEEAISKADSPDDIAQALRDCASAVDDVKDEYQSGLEALPQSLQDAGGPGGQTQEKIDGLEEFSDSLGSAADDIEGEEFDDEEEKEEQIVLEKQQEWIDELRQKASDVLGELSL